LQRLRRIEPRLEAAGTERRGRPPYSASGAASLSFARRKIGKLRRSDIGHEAAPDGALN